MYVEYLLIAGEVCLPKIIDKTAGMMPHLLIANLPLSKLKGGATQS